MDSTSFLVPGHFPAPMERSLQEGGPYWGCSRRKAFQADRRRSLAFSGTNPRKNLYSAELTPDTSDIRQASHLRVVGVDAVKCSRG
jgi:hypothetical protein